jgi:hypothetical protein
VSRPVFNACCSRLFIVSISTDAVIPATSIIAIKIISEPIPIAAVSLYIIPLGVKVNLTHITSQCIEAKGI